MVKCSFFAAKIVVSDIKSKFFAQNFTIFRLFCQCFTFLGRNLPPGCADLPSLIVFCASLCTHWRKFAPSFAQFWVPSVVLRIAVAKFGALANESQLTRGRPMGFLGTLAKNRYLRAEIFKKEPKDNIILCSISPSD